MTSMGIDDTRYPKVVYEPDVISLKLCKFNPRTKFLYLRYTDLHVIGDNNIWIRYCLSNEGGFRIKSHITPKIYKFILPKDKAARVEEIELPGRPGRWLLNPDNPECPVKGLYVIDDSVDSFNSETPWIDYGDEKVNVFGGTSVPITSIKFG